MDINIVLTPDLIDNFRAGFWLVLGIGLTSLMIWIVTRIIRH